MNNMDCMKNNLSTTYVLVYINHTLFGSALGITNLNAVKLMIINNCKSINGCIMSATSR